MTEWKVEFHDRFKGEITDLPADVRVELARGLDAKGSTRVYAATSMLFTKPATCHDSTSMPRSATRIW